MYNRDVVISEEDISNTFYVIRMFAIISVTFAHYDTFNSIYADTIRAMIGSWSTIVLD